MTTTIDLSLEEKPDGWLYDNEGNRVRPWFTTGGMHNIVRIRQHRLKNIALLEAKRWKAYQKLKDWHENQEDRVYAKIKELSTPVIGICPDYPDEKILLRPTRSSWTWFSENDPVQPSLEECAENQELVNELWYVVRRRQTIVDCFSRYHDVFHHALDRKYLTPMITKNDMGLLKWKAARLLINGREYILHATRSKHSGWTLEFEICPEDFNVLVLEED